MKFVLFRLFRTDLLLIFLIRCSNFCCAFFLIFKTDAKHRSISTVAHFQFVFLRLCSPIDGLHAWLFLLWDRNKPFFSLLLLNEYLWSGLFQSKMIATYMVDRCRHYTSKTVLHLYTFSHHSNHIPLTKILSMRRQKKRNQQQQKCIQLVFFFFFSLHDVLCERVLE